MLKELKYLLYLLTIFIFFFILLKFYLSDKYEKRLYRSLNNYDNVITKFSKNLLTLENDTKNIIVYVDNNTNKSKKKYQFWKLIEND